MARYRTPESLVCIGGAGRQIGETFLTQDWILEEILRESPREDAPDGDQHAFKRGITGYFIDTETSSSDGIQDEIDNITQRITAEHDIDAGPDIETEYVNLVEDIDRDRLEADALLFANHVRKIIRDNGSSAWWLAGQQQSGHSTMLDEFEDFRDGVERRRGLTKAVYQTGYSDADPLEQTVESIGNDDTAMIVGLGGGTGSGLFIDLAYRMRQEQNPSITLFAVLPDPDFFDKEDELANAYAALSELEYLALHEQSLFESIILLPLRPAEDHTVFDKAATYAITGFYNLRGDPANVYSIFDPQEPVGPPSYAPFTIAVPRYLRFLKEDIDTTEENFKGEHGFLDQKQTVQEAEESLYDEIASYIQAHHPDLAGGLYITDGDPNDSVRLDDGRARSLYANRLRPLQNLLEQDFLIEIDYDSAPEAATLIKEVENEIGGNLEIPEQGDEVAFIARELFDRLPEVVSSPRTIEPEQGFVAEEQEFAELVVDEIELIARRACILRIVDQLQKDYEPVAEDLEKAIDSDAKGFVKDSESELSEVKTDTEDVEAEIEVLESAVEEAKAEREEILSKWQAESTDAVETILTAGRTGDEAISLLKELESEVKNAKAIAEQANGADQIRYEAGTEFDSYARLNDLLDELGVDRVPESRIESTVEAMFEARRHLLNAESQSTIDELLSKVGIGRSTADYYDDYRQERINEIDAEVLQMTEPTEPFAVEIKSTFISDRREAIKDARETAVSDIVAATRDAVDAADAISLEGLVGNVTAPSIDTDNNPERISETVSTLRRELGAGSESQAYFDSEITPTDATRQLATERIKPLIDSRIVTPVEEALADSKEKISGLKTQRKQYETVINIVTDHGQAFTNALSNVDDIDEIPVYEDPSEPGPFRQEKMPKNRGAIGNASHLGETLLWEDDEMGEREIIKKDLKDLADLNFGSDHIGLRRIQPSVNVARDGSDLHHRKYDGHRAHTVFMSRLFDGFYEDENALIDRVTRVYTESGTPFEVGAATKDGYSATKSEFADAWDVSMTTFIGGVFLDNLKLFTNECRSAYLRHADIEDNADGKHNVQDSVPAMVMRHTYGLDGTQYHKEKEFIPDDADGVYVWRKRLLNFDNTSDIKRLFNQDSDIEANHKKVRNELRDEFFEIVGFPSTVSAVDVVDDE